MKHLPVVIIVYFLFLFGSAAAQKKAPLPKGKLFIMGGGDRPLSLMKSLLATAAMGPKDYVVVLPMSSEYPDTAYHYFKADFGAVCKNAIVNFNFTKENENNKNWLDSLAHARLIFITGGDQAGL
jgi:cyanophycinase